ncbi:MAG: ATP-dependent DNA helicase RecG [Gammaproteobacteria bacterium]|nr:ATP-dependent DNA helicase RecG [Gammaproteobacteria bacterium]
MSKEPIERLPVTMLKGVGTKVAEKLERLGIVTIQDMLLHFPYRYQDRTHIQAIGSLTPGQESQVTGVVELADVSFRGKRNLLVRISDNTGFLTLRFFHFSRAQQDRLQHGARLFVFGEARAGRDGLEMIHPEYELLAYGEDAEADEKLTPVYNTTEGLHRLSVRKYARQALASFGERIEELLPAEFLPDSNWPSLADAVRNLHEPDPAVDITRLESGRHPWQRRMAFEELLAWQLSFRQQRSLRRQASSVAITSGETLYKALLASLPFSPTAAQQRVMQEITEDLAQPVPMQRLVQGDVGSGKTLVAVAAACMVVEAGYQVAVMAPTELLADQHWRNFHQWLEPLGIRVQLLTGKLAAAPRRDALAAIAEGEARVVIGTHALFQEDVHYHQLGMVVVDEQHRFGVDQRLALLRKSANGRGERIAAPHQLVMTATPIPRTLAQTVYADLDVSVIDELPPGRTPVTTVVIPDNRRGDVVQRVRSACLGGRQAYWVCPLIEESEALQLQTATDMAEDLRQALPELRVGLIHGRLRPSEKEAAMLAFKAGELQLLVATTVIEVGVDVANATTMIIEHAERLGLSQLHQLRGRVGRGAAESSCVLLYQSPLSQLARERLAVLRDTNDGFEVARRDLELRGPGELLGTRQTGLPRFRVADLGRDQDLLPAVQQSAQTLEADQPLAEALVQRWLGARRHLGDV